MKRSMQRLDSCKEIRKHFEKLNYNFYKIIQRATNPIGISASGSSHISTSWWQALGTSSGKFLRFLLFIFTYPNCSTEPLLITQFVKKRFSSNIELYSNKKNPFLIVYINLIKYNQNILNSGIHGLMVCVSCLV